MSNPCINIKHLSEGVIKSKLASFDMEEPDY